MDNVAFESRSGPNSFGKKLAIALSKRGHIVVERHEQPDVQLSFITSIGAYAPRLVQRLDGVWFNSAQDWKTMNQTLMTTYHAADAVVAQSRFDEKLIKTFFGEKQMTVIPNGTDVEFIQSLDPLDVPTLNDVERVWSCASSWRPHKRLAENIRYFQEHAGQKDCLIIAGDNPDVRVSNDPRVFYAGDLDYKTLCQLYRSSDYFLHLAWLDHCPNVVVDARAAGCHIICSSSGGTSEVAGDNSTVVEEDEWDFKPCRLYEPPKLDLTRKRPNVYKVDLASKLDIMDTAVAYESTLGP